MPRRLLAPLSIVPALSLTGSGVAAGGGTANRCLSRRDRQGRPALAASPTGVGEW